MSVTIRDNGIGMDEATRTRIFSNSSSPRGRGRGDRPGLPRPRIIESTTATSTCRARPVLVPVRRSHFRSPVLAGRQTSMTLMESSTHQYLRRRRGRQPDGLPGQFPARFRGACGTWCRTGAGPAGEEPMHAIISDQRMPKMTGAEFYRGAHDGRHAVAAHRLLRHRGRGGGRQPRGIHAAEQPLRDPTDLKLRTSRPTRCMRCAKSASACSTATGRCSMPPATPS